MQGFVNTFRDFLVYFYARQDSKPVHMISSIRSTWQDVIRNSRDAVGIYRRLVLKQPTIIWLYNQGMGGTDSFDQKLSMYRTNVKVLGWYRKVIFHMMQCSVVNAHILLREKFQLDRKEDNFTLLMFMRNLIREIFAGCCENSDASEIDSGEDDEPLDDLYDLRGSYTRTSTLLSASNRLRGDHFPVQYEPRSGADGKDSRRRCRICSKKSNVRCNNVNCNVGLCINDCGDEPNCWAKFHKENKKII